MKFKIELTRDDLTKHYEFEADETGGIYLDATIQAVKDIALIKKKKGL